MSLRWWRQDDGFAFAEAPAEATPVDTATPALVPEGQWGGQGSAWSPSVGPSKPGLSQLDAPKGASQAHTCIEEGALGHGAAYSPAEEPAEAPGKEDAVAGGCGRG